MSNSVIIYWRLVRQTGTTSEVEFWSSLDTSDVIRENLAVLSESTLRGLFELVLGYKEFDLEQVK